MERTAVITMAARTAATWGLVALCLLGPDAHAAQPGAAALLVATAVQRVAGFDEAHKISERQLAQISGTHLSSPSPRLSQTGIAVILWDERTKVRGTAAVGSPTALVQGPTVSATLTVR